MGASIMWNKMLKPIMNPNPNLWGPYRPVSSS